MLTPCPHCDQQVVPDADGACPLCGGEVIAPAAGAVDSSADIESGAAEETATPAAPEEEDEAAEVLPVDAIAGGVSPLAPSEAVAEAPVADAPVWAQGADDLVSPEELVGDAGDGTADE